MGIQRKEVVTCTCDICGTICEEQESDIEITLCHTTVGRNYIYGNLSAYIPYCTSKGVVCKSCKLFYLEMYIQQEKGKV